MHSHLDASRFRVQRQFLHKFLLDIRVNRHIQALDTATIGVIGCPLVDGLRLAEFTLLSLLFVLFLVLSPEQVLLEWCQASALSRVSAMAT